MMIGGTSSRLSRRAVIGGLGAGVAAAGALAAPALNLSWTRRPGTKADWWDRQFTSLANAGVDEWSGRIGSEFALSGEAGGAIARLVEVQPFPTAGRRPPELRDRAFTLIFEVAEGMRPAADRIYDVSPAGGQDMKIYFSACGDACTGRLQAVFN